MLRPDLINQYNEFEDSIIRQFNAHEFYVTVFPSFSKDEFTQYLLQLGHLSTEFVKFLERAKLPLQTETGKEAVRNILRDEIPAEGPTHQDSRFADLRKLGLSSRLILNTPPTAQTNEVIDGYYELISYPQDNYDLRVVVVLRVIGEILVGETYKHVVRGLKKHSLLDFSDSTFYAHHWRHDIKGGAGDTDGIGHTEYYDNALAELVTNQRQLEIAKESASRALNLRNVFHEQYLK